MSDILDFNSFKNGKKESSKSFEDETLERLVAMTIQTNLVALDKVIAANRRAPLSSYAAASARINSISERLDRAVYEVGMTLPLKERVTLNLF